MGTSKELSRSEQLEKRWRSVGLAKAKNPELPSDAANLDIRMVMDEPLQQATTRRLIDPSIGRANLRTSLMELAIDAQKYAEVIYFERAAALHGRQRQIENLEFLEKLKQFSTSLLSMSKLTRIAEKHPALAEEIGVEDLIAIHLHSEGLITALKRMVSYEPCLEGDATKEDEREFFTRFATWWERQCLRPEARGANTCRNKIAAAVWRDAGGLIPSGYGSDERWARGRFNAFLGKSA